MNNFIFYDTETSGVKELDFIQVIQFAAIQTNDNFIKTNSFNEFCSPLPWTLISPKALLVNKKKEIFNTNFRVIEDLKPKVNFISNPETVNGVSIKFLIQANLNT